MITGAERGGNWRRGRRSGTIGRRLVVPRLGMRATRGIGVMIVRHGYRFRRLAAPILGLALVLGHTPGAAGQGPAPAAPASGLLPGAQDGFVDSGGVKIHYVSLGRSQDPLLIMIHGFP